MQVLLSNSSSLHVLKHFCTIKITIKLYQINSKINSKIKVNKCWFTVYLTIFVVRHSDNIYCHRTSVAALRVSSMFRQMFR